MKKLFIIFITCSLLITGCNINKNYNLENSSSKESNKYSTESNTVNSENLNSIKTSALIIDAFTPNYYDGNIYYIDKEDNISAINEITGESTTIIDINGKIVDFTISENILFYWANNNNDYSLHYGEMKNLENINTLKDMTYKFQDGVHSFKYMIIKDNIIYYAENNNIFVIDINKKTKKEISVDKSINVTSLLYVIKDIIYFIQENKDENFLYSLSIDDKLLTKQNSFTFNTLEDNKNIFYYNNEIYYVKKDSLSRIIKIDKTGNSSTIFRGFNIDKIKILKDNLFILDDTSISKDLFVSNKEDKTKLIATKVTDFCVGENEIFYSSEDSNNKFYINKVNLLGEEKVSLVNLENLSLSEILSSEDLLYFTLENGDLHSYNTNNKETTFIDKNVSKISLLGNNLVYSYKNSSTEKIYLPNIETQVEESITEELTIEEPSPEEIISNLIIDFDNAWADYVNEENELVKDYIAPNSPIYDYLSKFQRNIIDEEFLNIEVKATRIKETTGEVDVNETLKKVVNGVEEIKNYQWTYSVILVDDEWKVYNYKKR